MSLLLFHIVEQGLQGNTRSGFAFAICRSVRRSTRRRSCGSHVVSLRVQEWRLQSLVWNDDGLTLATAPVRRHYYVYLRTVPPAVISALQKATLHIERGVHVKCGPELRCGRMMPQAISRHRQVHTDPVSRWWERKVYQDTRRRRRAVCMYMSLSKSAGLYPSINSTVSSTVPPQPRSSLYPSLPGAIAKHGLYPIVAHH